MQLPALVFPQTALRRSLLGLLWPLCQPVIVLEPASQNDAPAASPLVAAGLIKILRSSASPAAGPGPDPRELERLLRQWKAWAAQHQGSVLSEAMKAGIELPYPDTESFRQLRQEIKNGQPQVKPLFQAVPQLSSDDLFLRLMQLKDQEAAQMEELKAKVELGQKRLAQIIGLEEEDVLPADYEEPFWQKLPPLEHSLESSRHLARRLKAWASLARGRGVDLGEAWLASGDLEAVVRLLEAANRRLLPSAPAGAEIMSLWPPPQASQPGPDSPLAQEATRLLLPDLRQLSDEQFIQLQSSLEQSDVLGQIRQGLLNLLQRLAQEPWREALRQDLAAPARMLAESLTNHLTALDLPLGPARRGFSILVLPGLNRDQALSLLAGYDQGLPSLAEWPQASLTGSCPILAAW